MKYLLAMTALFVMNGLAASNLNITPADDGTDILWLSWTISGEFGIVCRYDGPSMVGGRVFLYCQDGVSSTITEDPSGGIHLLFSKRDSLFSLNPETMVIEDTVSFEEMSEFCRTGLLRRSANPALGLLALYRVTYASSGASFHWQTSEYTVSESGLITMGDSLILEDPYPVSGSDYMSDFMFIVYPVMNASGYPVMATRQFFPGGSMPPTPASWRIATLCHNTTASAVYLTADTLVWSTNENESPQLITSGSCTSNAIFLWSDSTETVYYSLHDCETGIVSTMPYTGEAPSPFGGACISADPDDPGMLMVWSNGTDIVCRHYENGWNDYTYVVAESVSGVFNGSISVCSTQDGYWVAYFTVSDPDPVVFFVDRDDVTSIETHTAGVDPISVTAFPNPFREALSVQLNGNGADVSFHAMLFDHTGRVTREETSNGGTLLWNTVDLPVGCYLLRVTAGNNVYTQKTVLVR
ncbi:MAG: T9SS type A sorting domain-containing protein [Candidatus Sabulitectum sp.]|nr:T9SS type A sorting domain-containing protein [Candidatus Sabulitectum sp.]